MQYATILPRSANQSLQSPSEYQNSALIVQDKVWPIFDPFFDPSFAPKCPESPECPQSPEANIFEKKIDRDPVVILL